MKIVAIPARALALLTLVMFISGCSDSPSSNQDPSEVSGSPAATSGGHDHDDDHSGHGHEDEHQGPHGGHVIELGRNHEYHAELVEDEEAGTVIVYLLDKDLKELPIDQSSIVMNLTVDGQAKTFELASADANGGKTARFDATGRSLFEALHEHEATGKLQVSINGTPYSGAVEHHHHGDDEDAEHNHEH